LYTLCRDRAMTLGIGQRGRDGVREHYTIRQSVDKLLTVYGNVITRREVHARPEGRVYVH
jgi:hypothetical protein